MEVTKRAARETSPLELYMAAIRPRKDGEGGSGSEAYTPSILPCGELRMRHPLDSTTEGPRTDSIEADAAVTALGPYCRIGPGGPHPQVMIPFLGDPGS